VSQRSPANADALAGGREDHQRGILTMNTPTSRDGASEEDATWSEIAAALDAPALATIAAVEAVAATMPDARTVATIAAVEAVAATMPDARTLATIAAVEGAAAARRSASGDNGPSGP
jgi:hypothetical protein